MSYSIRIRGIHCLEVFTPFGLSYGLSYKALVPSGGVKRQTAKRQDQKTESRVCGTTDFFLIL